MSQYPSPYQPPTPPYPGYDYYSGSSDALAPAKRAGILMFTIAGLLILGSLCCGAVGAMLPQLMAEHPESFSRLQEIPEATPHRMQAVLVGSGILCALFSVILGLLGFFVRKGGKGAIITSIGLSSIAIALLALWSLAGVAQGELGACILVIPLALFVLLVVWLVQAVRASGSVQAMQNQYMQQYWQHLYQQQMYSQQQPYPPGGTPPISSPPASPPPSSPPPPPPAPPGGSDAGSGPV
jgi:TM2 domain-containing membrane protein YozV